MILEFSGPTSTGKTRFSGEVLAALSQEGFKVGAIHEFWPNACPLIPAVVSESQRQRFPTDLAMLPWMAWAILSSPAFFCFAMAKILFCPEPWGMRHNMFRAVCRRLAIHRFLSSARFADWIIVWDEGTLHLAHNILVFSHQDPILKDAQYFARHVPLPDLAVLMLGAQEDLVRRTLARKDPTPRLTHEREIFSFIEHAAQVFKNLAKTLPPHKILIVSSAKAEISPVLDRIRGMR